MVLYQKQYSYFPFFLKKGMTDRCQWKWAQLSDRNFIEIAS